MAKGIIVVDVPEACRDCACCQYDGQYDRYCGVNGKDLMNIDWNGEKPDWCPIKELQPKLEEINCPHSMSDYQRKGFSRGWNACLDKIERSAGE